MSMKNISVIVFTSYLIGLFTVFFLFVAPLFWNFFFRSFLFFHNLCSLTIYRLTSSPISQRRVRIKFLATLRTSDNRSLPRRVLLAVRSLDDFSSYISFSVAEEPIEHSPWWVAALYLNFTTVNSYAKFLS